MAFDEVRRRLQGNAFQFFGSHGVTFLSELQTGRNTDRLRGCNSHVSRCNNTNLLFLFRHCKCALAFSSSDGYGISLRVLYGKLRVEDGIADRRRSIIIDRTGSKLERLVIIGKTGTLTLEALAWLRAMGAALVQIGSDGALLTRSIPFGYAGLPIRRAQALAVSNGLAVDVARDVISQKLRGQRANLVRLKARDTTGFDRLVQTLNGATTTDEIRLVEAKAAAIYWNAWTDVPIHFKGRDLARIPARWARYDSRASILTGAPRAATNPVNALLNYLYSLAESETRLALLAAGLDPTLGVLHADQRNRDSFALDTMETVRPGVDAFVLDLLKERVFTSRDFVELPNGICRLRAPLTHDLAMPRAASSLHPSRHRLSQHLAKLRNHDPMRAKRGRLRSQRASRSIRPLVHLAVSRSLSGAGVTARSAYRSRVEPAANGLSQSLAKPSQRNPPRVTTRAQAHAPGATVVRQTQNIIGATANGNANTVPHTIAHGFYVRSRQNSMPYR